MPITAATLFSGIGAPEASMPGWEWLWCAEIEPFPAWVLHHRQGASGPQRLPDPWEPGISAKIRQQRLAAIKATGRLPDTGKTINLGDVNAPDFVERARAIGRPDVLIFGSPCQDFSVAGKRVGMDGARGNMALVGLRIARDLGIEWVAFENVPGFFSSYSGSAETESTVRKGDVGGWAECDEDSDFAAFLSALRECGYLGCYRVFDAQYSGVPQRRRRIFVVGRLGDWTGPFSVLFEPDSLRGDHPPRREAREGIAGTVKTSLARCSADEVECGTLIDGNPDVAWALQERDAKGADSNTKEGHLIVTPALADPITANEQKSYTNEGKNFRTRNVVEAPIPILEAGARTGRNGHEGTDGLGVGEPGDPMFTLQSSKQHAVLAFDTTQITHPANRSKPYDRSPQLSQSGHAPAIAFSCKDYGADASTGVSPTLRSMDNDASHANGGGQVAIAFSITPSNSNKDYNARPVDRTQAITTNGNRPSARGGDLVESPVAFQTRVARNGRGGPEEVVPALNGADAGATSDMRPCVASGTAVRRLTPKECERLQGFEDDYTLVKFGTKLAADGPRYKALGNSMNVKDIGAILRRLEAFKNREPSK